MCLRICFHPVYDFRRKFDIGRHAIFGQHVNCVNLNVYNIATAIVPFYSNNDALNYLLMLIWRKKDSNKK